MEKSSFFNSVSHDRTYKAEDWAEYFASFIGNGVFPVPSTGLQVVANDGMKLNVKTGKAWINGYFYFNTGDLAVELDTADGQLNRIDRVVVRWDLTNRVMSVKVKSSSFSASPTAPALQRDADIYELALADIYVGAGVTAITQISIHVPRTGHDVPAGISFEDTDEAERHVEREGISIIYSGRTLKPIRTTRGLVFIESRYLSPVADALDVLELYERRTAEGMPYIVAKAGFLLQAVIMPCDVINQQFVESLQDLTRECEFSLSEKERREREARDRFTFTEPEQCSLNVDPDTGEVVEESEVADE